MNWGGLSVFFGLIALAFFISPWVGWGFLAAVAYYVWR